MVGDLLDFKLIEGSLNGGFCGCVLYACSLLLVYIYAALNGLWRRRFFEQLLWFCFAILTPSILSKGFVCMQPFISLETEKKVEESYNVYLCLG